MTGLEKNYRKGDKQEGRPGDVDRHCTSMKESPKGGFFENWHSYITSCIILILIIYSRILLTLKYGFKSFAEDFFYLGYCLKDLLENYLCTSPLLGVFNDREGNYPRTFTPIVS